MAENRKWPWQRDVASDDFPTVPFDEISWGTDRAPARIVAIGDIHGDLRALLALLERTQLIDRDGNWAGGDSHLVLMGDLVAGHRDSRALVELVRNLEKQARWAKGMVHPLLGNHDLLPVKGDLSRMTRREKKQFREGGFRGDTELARWARSRNTVVKVGDSLFVHAGLDHWAREIDLGRLNATVRAWIRYWQGVDAKPPKRTRWAVGGKAFEESGPLWMRGFKSSKGEEDSRPANGPSRKQLAAILDRNGAQRLVIGHAPTRSGEIHFAHPYYGPGLIMLDTRISDRKHGNATALEIRGAELEAIYVDVPREEHPLEKIAWELVDEKQASWSQWLRALLRR